MTKQGRYVYQVEERCGRGRSFVRMMRSVHEDAADALSAMQEYKIKRPVAHGDHRYVISKQWQELGA